MSAIQLPPGYAAVNAGFVGTLYDLVNPGTTTARAYRDSICAMDPSGAPMDQARSASCDLSEKVYSNMVTDAVRRLAIIAAVLAAIPIGIFVYKRRK